MSRTSIGRDLKGAGRRKHREFAFSTEFFTGLAAGLVVAVAVYIWQQQTISAMQSGMMEKTVTTSAGQAASELDTQDETTPVFDFPTILPTREVIIVEQGWNADSSPVPSAPIRRPGSYVMHLGIFSEPNQAKALKETLLRLGLRSEILNITVDSEIQYRVRIGVISDLTELNRIRSVLQRSEIKAVRVGE